MRLLTIALIVAVMTSTASAGRGWYEFGPEVPDYLPKQFQRYKEIHEEFYGRTRPAKLGKPDGVFWPDRRDFDPFNLPGLFAMLPDRQIAKMSEQEKWCYYDPKTRGLVEIVDPKILEYLGGNPEYPDGIWRCPRDGQFGRCQARIDGKLYCRGLGDREKWYVQLPKVRPGVKYEVDLDLLIQMGPVTDYKIKERLQKETSKDADSHKQPRLD